MPFQHQRTWHPPFSIDCVFDAVEIGLFIHKNCKAIKFRRKGNEKQN